MTRKTTKTRKPLPLQHEIDGNIVENDIDALAEMLLLYENEDDVRFALYEAIDIVTTSLARDIEVNTYQII